MKDLFTKRMVENIVYYALCFFAVGVTPYLALPIAPLFDWAGYGLMFDFFVEIFTVIFWAIELCAFYFIRRKSRKNAAKKVIVEEAAEASETQTENVEKEEAPKQKKKLQFPKLEKTPLLPMRNVVILFAIVVACIFIISAQIGFQVKPIYDIGEKVTGYEILNKIGWLGKNVAKCVWILLLLRCAHEIATEALTALPGNKKKWYIPLFTGGCLLLFGVFDVLVSANPFALTYLLFYVAFTAIFYLTERNVVKALLLIILIYLF